MFQPGQQLFNREWAVTLGQALTSTGIAGAASATANALSTGNKYTRLKVVFEIEKSSDSTPNKGKIEVYNFSEQSRVSYQKKGLTIRLDAGYKGLTETLYIGDVAKTHSKRTGPDIVTTFEAGDGEKNLVNAHFEKSYPPGTPVLLVVTDLALALGVTVGPILGIPADVYAKGATFSGSVKHQLDKITKTYGLEWSVQTNVLQILPIKTPSLSSAILLNKNTGLIGVPSKKESGVEFISLLNPKIIPGALILLQSGTIKGSFKVKKAKFEGDSHGDKWQVKCEGVEIAASEALPKSQISASSIA